MFFFFFLRFRFLEGFWGPWAVLGGVWGVFFGVFGKVVVFGEFRVVLTHFGSFFSPDKPFMIITEYMENGALDKFLRVGDRR